MTSGRAASGPDAAPLALHLADLSKTFGGQKALDQVALEVRQGEVHGLLGQNGSGKSTLIKVLAGFHPPDPGSRLHICGTEVPLPLAPGAFRHYRMSFVHQHLGLIPSLTVVENLLIGRLAGGHAWAINWAAERRLARARFERYGIDIDPGAAVSTLPPVQRALLAIVRAAGEMSDGSGEGNGLLILDEPTPFLPKQDVQQLFRLMRSIVATGASAIFVSHDVDEVMAILGSQGGAEDRPLGLGHQGSWRGGWQASGIRLLGGQQSDTSARGPLLYGRPPAGQGSTLVGGRGPASIPLKPYLSPPGGHQRHTRSADGRGMG